MMLALTGTVLSTGKPRSARYLPTGFVMVLPLLFFITLFFNLPLLATVLWSLYAPSTGTLTVDHYAEFFGSQTYLSVVARTFRIALVVSLACAILGYPATYWISDLSRRNRVIALGIVITSFWVSILVRTYAWIVILGNGGLVNRGLQGLHITDRPIQFLYGEFGVALGMVNVLLPYMMLPLYSAMVQVDPRLKQISSTLGASSRQYFWRVFFPITCPALAAATVLVFILSIGFYITPAILGGGRVPMIANMLDTLINRFPRWGLAAAMSVSLLAFTFLAFRAYQWIRSRSQSF
jgi:putative spermidine/putrescine transport system permease protein